MKTTSTQPLSSQLQAMLDAIRKFLIECEQSTKEAAAQKTA
jgi:hypothetical protein